MAHVFKFKWSLILIETFVILSTLKKASNVNASSETSLKCNCLKFNNTKIFGGQICGTDGVTYANKAYLACLNKRDGKDIATAHPGLCLPGEKHCQHNYIYSPVCARNGTTWSNIESLQCHKLIHNNDIEKRTDGNCKDENIAEPCTEYGIDKYESNPVCASNGFTYKNIAQVKCQRKNDYPDLYVLYNGGCTVEDVRKIRPIEEIMTIAKFRNEWNPICGTDNKTYLNPFVFIVKQEETHSALKVAFHGSCDSMAHKACIRAGKNFNPRDGGEIEEKFEGDCSNLICGNNGFTYQSIHHLRCDTNRDKYLSFKHSRRCRGPNDNPCGAIPSEEIRSPICASDNISYISIEAMWCINRQNNTNLTLRHDGPCLRSLG